MKNLFLPIFLGLLAAAIIITVIGPKPSPKDHASEFMLDINNTATCTYWGKDKNEDDVALCKVQTYLVRCVAGPNTDKPNCNAVVNLAPAPAPAAPALAPAPAPAAGSGSGQ